MNLKEHLENQIAFSTETFGPGQRVDGICDHIRKELQEITEAEDNLLEEWIDVIILACDGAWRSGATPEQICSALESKLAKNQRRHWPDWRTAETNKAIEHIRGHED